MKKLVFSTVLSTLIIFGANAAEENYEVQQTPEPKRVSTLIIELPSELPNAVINISVPGETQPQIFYQVKNGHILNLTVPLLTTLGTFKYNAAFPYFNQPYHENICDQNEPNILAIMRHTASDENSPSFYVEGPMFHQDSYVKTGNNIFDNAPLAKDVTPAMKLVVRMSDGVSQAYRIFSEIVS